MIIEVDKEIPNVEGKMKLGGQWYYKVKEVSRMEKMKNYFFQLRNTDWEKQIYSKLTSTGFLENINGTPLCFTINDRWMHELAPNEMIGTWIHKSLLFPFVIMSGVTGLHYMASRFNLLLEENEDLNERNLTMAKSIVNKSDIIKGLEEKIEKLTAHLNPRAMFDEHEDDDKED